MNSVITRAIAGNGLDYESSKKTEVQQLPASYRYSDSLGTHSEPNFQQRIKWTNPGNYDNFKHSRLTKDSFILKNDHRLSEANFKFSNTSQNPLNRSNSTDAYSERVDKTDKSFPSNINGKYKGNLIEMSDKKKPSTRAKIGRNESLESIIEMHKFFKEKNIYSDPNDSYKRRTIVLVKNNFSYGQKNSHNSDHSADFGFHLQSYGLVNTTTLNTEFICFVSNVQPSSPAKQAGLNDGDVLLAIDGIPINEFKNLHEIMIHVRGKHDLRLVVMCENVCKKIQLQQRVESLKKKLENKKKELERLTKQQDSILSNINKNVISSFASPLSSSTSSSITNSSISESHIFSPSPSYALNASQLLSPDMQGINNNNINKAVQNSTPNDLKTSTILSPSSNISQIVNTREKAYQIDHQAIIEKINDRQNKSNSSPNGTARIQVDINLDLTSPIIPTSSSSYSTYSSSSTASSSSANSTNSSAFAFNKTRQLAQKCIQQTSRIVRSASSSSMNIISNLKLNRSSRSRNSSICSTLNDSADLSDLRKSKHSKYLNNSLVSDVSKTISDQILVNKENLNLSKKKSNITKTSSLNNKKSDTSISQMVASDSKKQPLMMNPPTLQSNVVYSQSSSTHRQNMFKKLNNKSMTSSSDSSTLDTSLTNRTSHNDFNFSSKFTILQNKPKNEKPKNEKQKKSNSTNSETQNSMLDKKTNHDKSFFCEPFSPILSNQSSLLNEIIDSGIDVGIGLPLSPNNSSSSTYSDDRIAKVISDGGYASFINDFSINDITYSNENKSIKNVSLIDTSLYADKKINVDDMGKLSDDYLITKL